MCMNQAKTANVVAYNWVLKRVPTVQCFQWTCKVLPLSMKKKKKSKLRCNTDFQKIMLVQTKSLCSLPFCCGTVLKVLLFSKPLWLSFVVVATKGSSKTI